MAKRKAGKRRRRRLELTDEQRVAATIAGLQHEERLIVRVERKRMELRELIEGPPLDPQREICEASRWEQAELNRRNEARAPANKLRQLPNSAYEAINLSRYLPET